MYYRIGLLSLSILYVSTKLMYFASVAVLLLYITRTAYESVRTKAGQNGSILISAR